MTGIGGSVDVPGVGSTDKKVLLAIAGGGAAYVLYRYNKARKDAAAAAAATADTPGFGDGSGGVLPVVPGATAGVGIAGGETTTTANGNVPTTNAAWTQTAEQYLVGAGYDPGAVLKALGDYLASKSLTSDEQAIVQAAIAVAGYPPVGNITIIPGGDGAITHAVTGLHITGVSDTSFQLNWYALAGASGYHVYEGTTLVATDHGTYHPFTGRKPATSYGPFTVRGLSMSGQEGPASDPVTARTTGTPVVTGGTPVTSITPAGLHVLETTSSSIALGWYAIEGAQGYYLYRNGKRISDDHGTYHVDRGLRRGTSYRYSLIAYDALGHHSHSSAAVTGRTNR